MEAGQDTLGSAPGVLQRERAAFDARAAGRNGAAMPPREFAPGISFYEDTILETVGDVSGARVLDLCCGEGDLSLRLLQRGARVTGIDLSPSMVRLATERAAVHLPGAEAGFAVAPAEETALASGSFDWVVGKFALHHLDLDRAAAEIERVLVAGGRAVFVETSDLSPVLGFARRHLVGRFGIPRAGTEDEHPLGRGDLAMLAGRFDDFSYDFPDFVFFHLLSRHVIELNRIGPAARGLDSWIERRASFARRWSYAMRVQLRRA